MTAVTPNTLQNRPHNVSSLVVSKPPSLAANQVEKQNSSPFKARRRLEPKGSESFYLRQDTLMPELIPKHINGRLIPLNNKAMRDY